MYFGNLNTRRTFCPLGPWDASLVEEPSDNLLTTYDNLKQVATTFVHRCFDNLTTFYKKIIV